MQQVDQEYAICKFILNSDIRLEVGRELQEWMFTLNELKSFIKLIFNEFNDTKVNYDLFISRYKVLPSIQSVSNQSDIINRVTELFNDTIDYKSNKIHVLRIIEDFIKNCYLVRGVDEFTRGLTTKARDSFSKMTNLKLGIEKPNYVGSSNDIEILKSISIPNSKPIPSSISLINSCSSYSGFKRGDLCVYCAPPKTGKSTIMVQEGVEALKNGYKVLHQCFGDMDSYDIICKYVAKITGEPLDTVIHNCPKYYDECKELLSNLRFQSFPAGQKTIFDVVNYCKKVHDEFNFDVVVIDYDANIQSGTDNLYEGGGIVYTQLKGMAEELRCVVLVGSQPKQQYWSVEVLPMESASESSKKQHCVDYMITIGRNEKCKNIGTLLIAAMRRGEGGKSVRVSFEYNISTIKEINKIEYEKLLKSYVDSKLGELDI